MSCWMRPEKVLLTPCEEDCTWLTAQLKFAREQLDKKARLGERLAEQLRAAQAELDRRNGVAREVRHLLGATNAELRAATHAGAAERAEHAEEAAALHSEVAAAQDLATKFAEEAEQLRRRLHAGEERSCEDQESPTAAQRGLAFAAATAAAAVAAARGRPPAGSRLRGEAPADAPVPSARLGELEEAAAREASLNASLQEELQACQDQCVWLQDQRAVGAAAAAAAQLDGLRADCARERHQREEAERQLQALRAQRAEEVRELRLDIASMSSGLEQKEEDILSIQFEMVQLQNQLRDQTRLIYENADAFQQASEELADKDDKLENMKASLTQMNDVSLQLQRKVKELTQELDGSRTAYQALDEQHRAVVARLEADRLSMAAELERLRGEVGADTASLRAELQRREAASAQQHASLELELRAARADAERSAHELERRLRSQQVAAARAAAEAGFRETRLLEELQAEGARHSQHGSLLQLLRDEAHADGVAEMLLAEADAQRTRELQEQLTVTTERLAAAEAQLLDLAAALERSRLLERQARESAQEYRSTLELHRDFGKESFFAAAPRCHDSPLGCGSTDTGTRGSEEASPAETADEPEVQNVLIAAELDLGPPAGRAVLSVAPWQTRSDFGAVVQEFLEQHRVKLRFASALVRFLEQVEAEATTFPAIVKADLAELQSRYG